MFKKIFKKSEQKTDKELDWTNIHQGFSWNNSTFGRQTYQQRWERNGFDYEETKKWIQVGFRPNDAWIAKEWEKLGFTSEDVNEWIQKGLKNSEFDFANYLKNNDLKVELVNLEAIRSNYLSVGSKPHFKEKDFTNEIELNSDDLDYLTSSARNGIEDSHSIRVNENNFSNHSKEIVDLKLFSLQGRLAKSEKNNQQLESRLDEFQVQIKSLTEINNKLEKEKDNIFSVLREREEEINNLKLRLITLTEESEVSSLVNTSTMTNKLNQKREKYEKIPTDEREKKSNKQLKKDISYLEKIKGLKLALKRLSDEEKKTTSSLEDKKRQLIEMKNDYLGRINESDKERVESELETFFDAHSLISKAKMNNDNDYFASKQKLKAQKYLENKPGFVNLYKLCQKQDEIIELEKKNTNYGRSRETICSNNQQYRQHQFSRRKCHYW